MLFHYPMLNMTGFTYPEFNFISNIYALQNEVYRDIDKS